MVYPAALKNCGIVIHLLPGTPSLIPPSRKWLMKFQVRVLSAARWWDTRARNHQPPNTQPPQNKDSVTGVGQSNREQAF